MEENPEISSLAGAVAMKDAYLSIREADFTSNLTTLHVSESVPHIFFSSG
jgi:hypothetical protein